MAKRRKPAAAKPAKPAADPKDMRDPANWPKEMRDIARPLSSTHPYERNARTHPPAQIELLSRLLLRFGPDQPIVDDEDAILLKGHGRRLAAIAAGFEVFPVVTREGLSEEDKIALRISDNQVALLSGWDNELVKGEIAQLSTQGYEVALLGFGDKQLVQFTTTPGPPAGFQSFGEDIPTAFCCPKCAYAWSGNPLAGKDPEEVKKAKKK